MNDRVAQSVGYRVQKPKESCESCLFCEGEEVLRCENEQVKKIDLEFYKEKAEKEHLAFPPIVKRMLYIEPNGICVHYKR